MEARALTSPPPDPPELPAGAARFPPWPWWFVLAGFPVGLGATLVLAAILGAVAAAFGADPESHSPELVVVGTLAQGLAFVATAVFFASRVARPKAWHFGLRGTRFWPALGWAALGVASFYLVSGIYGAIVQPDVEQGTVEALGAEESTVGLIVAGLMVIVIAPVVEEIFFRGFVYRALRSRLSIWAAAAIDGVLFGAVHYNFEGAEALLLLPPLVLLGFLFCLVYERTGSLLPAIAMHAFNNTVAYAVLTDGGWQVSVLAGPVVVAACVLAPRLLPSAPRTAPA